MITIRKTTWSDRSDAGIAERSLGVHEGQKEILAGTHHHNHAVAGRPDRVDTRLSGGAVHLHLILSEGTAVPP